MIGEELFQIEGMKYQSKMLHVVAEKAEAMAETHVRMADNMKLYTAEEFQSWYGVDWQSMWDEAVPISPYTVQVLMPDGSHWSSAWEQCEI